jgi:hypothetical protein
MAALLAVASPAARAEAAELSGHVKGRLLADLFPDNSVFAGIVGEEGLSGEADIRLKLSADRAAWTLDADYQGFAILGDSVRIASRFALPQGPATIGVLDDERRWFDLTHTIRDRDDTTLIHRLDRLSVTWAAGNAVVRFGRQTLTWGSGLFFSPFDIVNPLDPAAVDTEYKTGDDMLYAQYLRSDGDDLQFAYVVRRDPESTDVDRDESTAALKYHGIAGDSEYDLLIARNRGRTTLGVGGNRGIGGAVLRADLIVGEGGSWTAEGVVNVSYSWMWWGRNLSAAIEYYYNGWGISDGDYGALAGRPELVERLARGETFTIGRNYLGAGVTVELTPLWLLTPNLFANLDDPSALLQVVSQYSLGDNLSVLAAANFSLGPDGSEFGGIVAGQPGLYLSRTAGFFAQLSWYF